MKEQKSSNVRKLFVAVLDSNNKNELMTYMAQENQTLKQWREEGKEILYPIDQEDRKGLSRPNIEKYENFNLGPYFEDLFKNSSNL